MFALIGDLVGSRTVDDRAGVHRRLVETLDDVQREVPGLQRLEPTVGDEFQGAYASIGDATRAALLVRLALLPVIDVRCGLGLGRTEVYDATRRTLIQDGPAWWAARASVEHLGAPRRASLRTWLTVAAAPDGVPDGEAVDADLANAVLLCRDALVDRLSERGWRMLRLALLGETQQRIAATEGISKSAVSQQFSRGIAAVRDAQDLLDRAGRAAGEEDG